MVTDTRVRLLRVFVANGTKKNLLMTFTFRLLCRRLLCRRLLYWTLLHWTLLHWRLLRWRLLRWTLLCRRLLYWRLLYWTLLYGFRYQLLDFFRQRLVILAGLRWL
ncbi:MAG: hypothetical protein AAGJ35_03935 [Myxococcota bacterium]